MGNTVYNLDLTQTPVINDVLSSDSSIEIISMESGEAVYARDYPNVKVYLLEGEVEVHRPEQVPHLYRNENKWNLSEPLFSSAPVSEYIRCMGDCQILFVSDYDLSVEEMDTVAISIVDTTFEYKPENESTKPEESSVDLSFLQEKCIRLEESNSMLSKMVDCQLLELESKTMQLDEGKEKITDLLNQINRKTSEQLATSNVLDDTLLEVTKLSGQYKLLKIRYAQKSKKYKKIKQEIKANVDTAKNDSVFNLTKHIKAGKEAITKVYNEAVMSKSIGITGNIANFLQKNVPQNVRFNSLEDNANDWHPIANALPCKNGLYYVSDGFETFVSYFNKNKGVFHAVNSFEVSYWSVQKVNLPQ